MATYWANPQDIQAVTSWIGVEISETDAYRLLFPEDIATLETMTLNEMYEDAKAQREGKR